MIKTLATIAIVAFGFVSAAPVAYSQQMDGRHCQWAYKKLKQHQRGVGVWKSCHEQSINRGKDGATDIGNTARARQQAAQSVN